MATRKTATKKTAAKPKVEAQEAAPEGAVSAAIDAPDAPREEESKGAEPA